MEYVAFGDRAFVVILEICPQTTVMTNRLILQIAQPYYNPPFCVKNKIIIFLILVG